MKSQEQKKEEGHIEKSQDAILVEILTVKRNEIRESLNSEEASFEFWKSRVSQRRLEMQAVNTLIDKYAKLHF